MIKVVHCTRLDIPTDSELSLLRPVNGKRSLCATVLSQQYFSPDPFLEFATLQDVWVAYVSSSSQLYRVIFIAVDFCLFPTEAFNEQVLSRSKEP